MSVSTPQRTITVALVGNPNTGKSTLFSALAGVRQRVGNYPGVTVEKKVGRTEFAGQRFELVDLPGTYSLAPRSPDEMVTVDVLLGRQGDVAPPDVVLCIVDASNLERNFYLLSQVLELGLPTVVAVNMMDVARDKGLTLTLDDLRKRVPVQFVEVQANRGRGLAALKAALVAAVETKVVPRTNPFPEAFQQEVAALAAHAAAKSSNAVPRYLVERLLLDTSGYLAGSRLPGVDEALLAEVTEARGRLAKAGCPVPAVEAMARYRWATEVLQGAVQRPQQRVATLSDRIDKALTHWLWGSVVFVLLMFLLFQAVFYVGGLVDDKMLTPASDAAVSLVENLVPPGQLQSLLVNGVIAGVGGVVVFLPQIFTLFFFIATLEDCGYMARAAYLMDKLMSRIGLSGKSFIPLLSSFACAVPGIMAARVIENRRDRLITILVAPLMSCSARLPVYTLLIGAFIPPVAYAGGWIGLQGIVMLAMYSVGIVAGIAVAWILKKTILRGATPPFVMELPSYKLPGIFVVLHRMFEQGWAFIYRAGTLILAVSVIVWGLAYYPHDLSRIDSAVLLRQADLAGELARIQDSDVKPSAAALASIEQELGDIDNHIAGTLLENSYLGRMGHFIEPAVKPLGWDWRIGCAAIASFPAREVVVATLGVIYNLGEGQEAGSIELSETLQNATWAGTDRRVFNIPVALSVMVFFALCAQCASTLAIMRRETGHWGWPAFTFFYMTALAYVAAMATYQIGIRLM
jgi:ferrous iron transport protein B